MFYYCQYKLARKIFRKAVKIAQNSYLAKKYVNLDKLKNTQPQKFWKKLSNTQKACEQTKVEHKQQEKLCRYHQRIRSSFQ